MKSDIGSGSDVDTDADLANFYFVHSIAHYSAFERKRLRNLKLNYEQLLSYGLKVTKPILFVPEREVVYSQSQDSDERNTDTEICDHSDRDDPEWTPSMDWIDVPYIEQKKRTAKKIKRKRKSITLQAKKCQRKDSSYDSDTPDTEIPLDITEFKSSSNLSADFQKCNYDNVNQRCHSKVFTDFGEKCFIHNPLSIVADTEVLIEDTEHRAWETLPPCLSILESKIPGAGLGVWTKEPIRTQTRFGPYKGELIKDKKRADNSGYCWKIGPTNLYVDAKDPSKSNWLRYVNCCRWRSEQSLIAYQYGREIFYKTVVDVPAGTELLVWYGDEYGYELNLQQEQMFSSYFKPFKKKRRKRCMRVSTASGFCQTKQPVVRNTGSLSVCSGRNIKVKVKERNIQEENDEDVDIKEEHNEHENIKEENDEDVDIKEENDEHENIKEENDKCIDNEEENVCVKSDIELETKRRQLIKDNYRDEKYLVVCDNKDDKECNVNLKEEKNIDKKVMVEKKDIPGKYINIGNRASVLYMETNDSGVECNKITDLKTSDTFTNAKIGFENVSIQHCFVNLVRCDESELVMGKESVLVDQKITKEALKAQYQKLSDFNTRTLKEISEKVYKNKPLQPYFKRNLENTENSSCQILLKGRDIFDILQVSDLSTQGKHSVSVNNHLNSENIGYEVINSSDFAKESENLPHGGAELYTEASLNSKLKKKKIEKKTNYEGPHNSSSNCDSIVNNDHIENIYSAEDIWRIYNSLNVDTITENHDQELDRITNSPIKDYPISEVYLSILMNNSNNVMQVMSKQSVLECKSCPKAQQLSKGNGKLKKKPKDGKVQKQKEITCTISQVSSPSRQLTEESDTSTSYEMNCADFQGEIWRTYALLNSDYSMDEYEEDV